MAFYEDDDDVDYKELRAQHELERADVSSIKNAFKLNLGNDADKFIALLEGQYHAPPLPGEPDRITKPIRETHLGSSRGRASWQDMEERDSTVQGVRRRIETPIDYDDNDVPTYRIPRIPAKYAEVINELERFRFSDNEDKCRTQMAVVATAIRTSLQELILEDVALNTRKAFGDYVDHIYPAPGGIKVIFNFNNAKCTVIAKGIFFGDETICVHSKSNKVVAGVYRIAEENSSDLSQNFEITVA